MKITITTTLTNALLLASAVGAATIAHVDRDRTAPERRAALRVYDGPDQRNDPDIDPPQGRTGPARNRRVATRVNRSVNTAEVPIVSENWAGAEKIGEGISVVSGTITVPAISVPAGGSSNTSYGYGGAAWVGIDGGAGCGSLFQAGIIWSTETGVTGVYEWLPDRLVYSSLTIAPGDSIAVTLVASSPTSATAYITNESRGETENKTFTGPTPLCQAQAEWIVEDFLLTDTTTDFLVPFAEFSPMSFRDCSMTDSTGTVNLSGATLLTMAQNGTTLATCSLFDCDTLDCEYGS